MAEALLHMDRRNQGSRGEVASRPGLSRRRRPGTRPGLLCPKPSVPSISLVCFPESHHLWVFLLGRKTRLAVRPEGPKHPCASPRSGCSGTIRDLGRVSCCPPTPSQARLSLMSSPTLGWGLPMFLRHCNGPVNVYWASKMSHLCIFFGE